MESHQEVNPQLAPNRETEDEDPQEILQDLLRVGPAKPVGYLALKVLTEYCHTDIEELSQSLRKRGLQVDILNQAESGVYSGALYAWHAPSLRKLLNENYDVIHRSGWPIEPEMFVRFLRFTAPNPDIRQVIDGAFGHGPAAPSIRDASERQSG